MQGERRAIPCGKVEGSVGRKKEGRELGVEMERRRVLPRVLLVTASFVPVFLADMQRARMLATSLPELGWEVEVLTVGSRFYGEETVDPEGDRLRVDGIRVHEVELTWERAWRAFGVGSMGWRAFWVMYKAGLRLLEAGNFDVVYISTAQFAFFCLGRLWKERAGVPYILDLHDPWVKPGGAPLNTRHRWKHVLNMALARPME